MISQNQINLQAELRWLCSLLESEDRPHRIRVKALSLAQEDKIGRGATERILARGGGFILSRDRDSVFITVESTGIRYRVAVHDEWQANDCFPRSRVSKNDLLTVPGLVRYIKFTRLLDSIKANRGRIYLYRLAYAIANPQADIYWKRGLADSVQVEISHKNRICCDDRVENLEALTRTVHLSKDGAIETVEFFHRLMVRETFGLDAIHAHECSKASIRTESCIEGYSSEQIWSLIWEQDYLSA